ncbi:hypothetical protein JCM10207_002842 [Rhodosporidiobolus poonsookiae]
MSFWKLPKTFAPAPTDGINGLLAPLSHLDLPADSSTPPSPLTPADVAAHHKALDALLDEPDLLSEIKSGTNQRLTDFLARKEIVLRLGGWVVWGLGRGILDDSDDPDADEADRDPLGSGLLPDGFEQGKVPDELLQAAEPKRKGMGAVPRRRDVDESGKFTEGDPDKETPDEEKWANYPRLCTEILVANSPALHETLFRHEAASSQPHTCPSPESFLLPFWESILGSTELQLASRAQQVGYWAKVNSALLDGPLGGEVLAQILQIPHLPPRLLALLPFCSPINDLLLLLLRISRPPSPLIPSTVTQTIRMLDPFSALGKPGHAAAEELLRGIIEVCLAVPRAQGGPAPGGGFGGMGGPGAGGEDPIFEWRDTTLVRQLADEKSVRTLLDWMLATLDDEETEVEAAAAAREAQALAASSAAPSVPADEDEKDEKDEASGDGTPTPASPVDAAVADALPSKEDEVLRRRDLRTSSLIASIAVLVELIRKNNSDFVEQQMLAWARRKEAAHTERQMLEEEGLEATPLPGRDSFDGAEDDRGPSVVDLGGMLSLVAERIGGFQRLIKKPRSSTAPVPTVSGKLNPLTLERFRICEFYAELLHCSNMSLVNRLDRSATLYDSQGYLSRGWQGADDLAAALTGPVSAGESLDAAPMPYSPDLTATRSDFSASPQELPVSTFSSSSPAASQEDVSGAGLSKEDAKELGEIVAAAERAETKGDKDDAASAEQDKAIEAKDALASPPLAADKRLSLLSNGTVSTMERDLPPTPSIYSVASRQLPVLPLPPGQHLKTKFIENGVIGTMLDLFFDFPWNNFLHNVVFDFLQQIFHGRLDRPLDHQLAVSVFTDARLCERILAGQARNDAAAAERVNMRLGYMGHMTLIAEETVKLFEQYPELHSAVESSVPQPAWNEYVTTTLRETRERDLTPLGGAGASLNLSMNKAPSSSSLSDEDDEFPMNSARAMRAMDTAGMAGGGAAMDSGAFGGHGRPGGLEAESGAGSLTDQFSRYLADALTNDRNAASSDEDEEDDNWLGGSRFDSGDFELESNGRRPQQFGFDDRFDTAGPSAFRSATGGKTDDEEWPPFESASTAQGDAFGSDDFTPTAASSSAANGGFPTSFDSDFVPASAGEDDDFGDFAGGDDDGFGTGTSITLPSMDAFGDFDFGEDSSSAFEPERPTFGGATSGEDDGSSRFGRLSLSGPFGDDSLPNSPADTASPLPPLDVALANQATDNAATAADRATSPTEPLGPALHEGAHLAQDGFVEAEVEGKTVRVPADDIILAHRRHSFEGRRASFERRTSSDSRRSSAEEPREAPEKVEEEKAAEEKTEEKAVEEDAPAAAS